MNYEDIQSGYDSVTNVINNLSEYLSVELKKQSIYNLFKDAFDDGVRLYNPETMELYYIVFIDDLEMVNSKVYNLSKQELRSSVNYITDLPIKTLKPISYDRVCEYIKDHSDKLDENAYCKLQTAFNVNNNYKNKKMNFLETFEKIFKDSSYREEQKQNILKQINEQDINKLETNDLLGLYYIMQVYAHDLDDNMLKKYYDIENKLLSTSTIW